MAYNTDPGWIKNKQDFNRASSGEELRNALFTNLKMLEASHTFKVKKGPRDWDPYHKMEVPSNEIEYGTNPNYEEWYENIDGDYVLTEDDLADDTKTYYKRSGVSPNYTYTEVDPEEIHHGTNPYSKGWYEKNGDTYTLTNDTDAIRDKKYYVQRSGYYYESEIEGV